MPLADDRRLLELALLLAQAEIDVVLGVLVDGHRRDGAQRAHREEAIEQRLEGRFVVDRVEGPLRDLGGVGRSRSGRRSSPWARVR